MSKKNILYSISILALALFSYGCKYELGPIFSFVSEEVRISRGWKFDKVLHNKVLATNGSADSIAYVSSFIGFDKGGRFSFLLSDIHKGHAGIFLYDGNWSFEDEKKNLVLNYDDTAKLDQKFRIMQLTDKLLTFRLNEGGNVTEYYLSPSK
jgi:hypothetical protein